MGSQEKFQTSGKARKALLGAIGILYSSALGSPGLFKWPFLFLTGKLKTEM